MPSANVAAPRTLAKNTADAPPSVPSAPINVCVARMADAPKAPSNPPDTIIRSLSIPLASDRRPPVDSARRFLDLGWTPALVEEGLERAVKPQDHEPAFAGQCLNPIAVLHAIGLLRAEIDRGRAVFIRLRRGARKALTPGPRKALRGLWHRTGLVVVERERPELRRGDVRRQRHLVGLGAVERIAAGIQNAEQILRADIGQPHDHRP